MNIARLRRGLTLPAAERRLAIEALLLLAVSRTLLAVLPFRIAVAWLGLRRGNETDGDDGNGSPTAAIVHLVADAVRRAASVAPFRAVCLQQAVTAALMLRFRGYGVQVHFGVARDADRNMIAHAWSRCQGVLVTGGQQMPGYAPISMFVT